MLAITELRIQLAALRTERDALLASLDARVTTTEVAVEDLRDKTAQVPAIDSNIGSSIIPIIAVILCSPDCIAI